MIESRTTATRAGGAVTHRQGRLVARYHGAEAVAPVTSHVEDLDVAAAAVQLRRLRYFRDLLVSGFESTIWPDRSGRTLRRERLALGIDLPELDAVAVWSVRCGDGTLAIPFIDYILEQALDAAGHFAPWDEGRGLGRGLERLERALVYVAPAGAPPAALPRLEEVHVPESLVAGLCGVGGALDHLVAACELITLTAVHLAPPEAS